MIVPKSLQGAVCRSFSAAQRARADELCRAGTSAEALAEDLGIALYSARVLMVDVRSELAAQGVPCLCGKPMDHRWNCNARDAASRVIGRRDVRYGATSKSFTSFRRRRATKLAKAGWGASYISREVKESVWRVEQLMNDLTAGGVQFATVCPGCGGEARHKGPCPVPKRCECGRWRYHRGPCREPKVAKPPRIEDRQLYRQAFNRYRDGASIGKISEATGLSWTTVQRLVKWWRSQSRYTLKPCACGRPARHPGGCIKNTPGAVGKLEQARIADATRAGEMPHRIASRLGVHVQTVLKHSAATRDEMFAEGKTCTCGRPVGHPYWCSTKWDAYDQPRGRRPFPAPQERLAIEALMRGDVVADIARAVGVGTDSVWRLRRSLSEGQRAQRTKAIRERIARAGRVQGEEIMAQIKASVPRGIDKAVRDDIEAELYLAVIEGRVEAEQIKAVVKSFISCGLSQWQSSYGPRSLDEQLHDDSNRTLGDLVGDETASGQLEDIVIGDEP